MESSKTRELVREVGTYAMMALVLICTCLYFLYSWQTKKQERKEAEARAQLEQQQREMKRREDQLRREKERLERERELAERRLKEEKRREEERAQKLAREKEAAERREAERKQRTVRRTPVVGKRLGVLEQVAAEEGPGKAESVRVDWWKNCPKDERPDQARHPMTYRVWTFGQTEEGWTCAGFEVTAEKGKPHARVVRLPREDGAEELVSDGDFDNLVKNSVQLVQLGRFWYLRDGGALAAKGKVEHGFLETRLEVADLYYGGLQRLLKEVKIVLPEVRVGILFDPRDEAKTKPFSVGEFSGRETLTEGPVFSKIRQYLEWRAKREMAQETETRTVTRKRVPRKPRVVFVPTEKLATNVRKNVDGTVFVSRGFHGTVYDSGGRLTTGYQTWMKWKERAEKEEQRYQAECEALARAADEPVRKAKPQPRAVSDADVRAAFERGILSWRLL